MNKKKRRQDPASYRDENSDENLNHIDSSPYEKRKKSNYIIIFQISLFAIFVMAINYYLIFSIVNSLQAKNSDQLRALETQLTSLEVSQREQIAKIGVLHQEQSTKLEAEQREQIVKLGSEQHQQIAKLYEKVGNLGVGHHQEVAKLHEQVTKLGAEQLKQFVQLGATSGQVAKTIYSKMASLTASLTATLNTVQPSNSSTPASQNGTNSSLIVSPPPSCPYVDMYTLGMNYGTDKVTTHIYHIIYQRYFEPVRCEPIRLLEIGLGCDMEYGPGASYYLWLEYFPNAEIYFIENDAACAKAWEKVDKRVHVFCGDQANATFLHEFVNESGGEFDFVIDDGGHTMNQQIVSFENLFPSLKPEGVYFIEDLLTSYIPLYDGGENVKNTTLNYIRDILGDLMSRRDNLAPNKRPISNFIARVDCIDENCAFTRTKNNETLSR